MLASAPRIRALTIALFVAMVVAFLAAAPAQAAPSTARVGSDGVLSYDAEPGQVNVVTITESNGTAVISDPGTGADSITPGAGCRLTLNPNEVECGALVDATLGIGQITVNVKDLDDTVTLTTTLATEVSGRDGKDTLNGGAGSDTLKGDDGDDVLRGNDGADYLLPEDQTSGLTGNDEVDGGAGSDWVTYTTLAAGVNVNLSLAGAQPTGGAGGDTFVDIENVNGSTGNDDLTGNAASNSLIGSDGEDVLRVAGGGVDSVTCGAGNDTAYLDASDTEAGTGACETLVIDAAPDTKITGPSNGAVITTSTPQFAFGSPDSDVKEFLCRFDDGPWAICPSSPLTADPPLGDGPHTFEVAASDHVGNVDQTPDKVSFTIDTAVRPGPGDGPSIPPADTPPAATPPQATATKIVIGSLVLISGNAVKMSKKGKIGISLTCAGASKCTGKLNITTAEPVTKKSRKLVSLGTKKFTIAPNKKRKVYVKFSKTKIRLAKRLKRFKAKALIREIDARGNLRLSSRLFTLRAR